MRSTPVLLIVVCVSVVLTACGVVAFYVHAFHARHHHLTALREEAALIRARPGDSGLNQRNEALRQQIQLVLENDVSDILGTLTDTLIRLEATSPMITNGAAEEHGAIQKLPLVVTFKGSFRVAFDVASRWHQDSLIVRLRRLEMTRKPPGDADQLDVSMQLDVFVNGPREAP